MRMSIGVPGLALYFEHDQVKPFIKDQAVKVKGTVPLGAVVKLEMAPWARLAAAESRPWWPTT